MILVNEEKLKLMIYGILEMFLKNQRESQAHKLRY